MQIGFIGTGNMGGAIIKGYLKARALDKKQIGSNIFICDSDQAKADTFVKELGVNNCSAISELASKCDIIFLAVKPNVYDTVLEELRKEMTEDKIIISMAAGINIDYIQSYLGKPTKIIRIMPNTPALVNESMTAVCKSEETSEKDLDFPLDILRAIGKVEFINEEDIHGIIGVSGSSPAYAYMFIEAIARAGEEKGLEYSLSLKMAAQSVLGASKMIMETGKSPNELVTMVCSPNGTTIEAVNTLKSNGFSSKVAEGVFAAIEKSKRMSESL